MTLDCQVNCDYLTYAVLVQLKWLRPVSVWHKLCRLQDMLILAVSEAVHEKYTEKCKSCLDGTKNTCYKHYKCRKGRCITCINIYNTNMFKYVSDLNIPNGVTKRLECPNCGERTFTVTNNMGSLLWNCFRVTWV
ncbi:MAG: hypothetical protein CM15mV148_390 [uncultured marine virus]|nr:MAG: hypothetical protein CM15mV148_390 [uncultured marine virus]